MTRTSLFNCYSRASKTILFHGTYYSILRILFGIQGTHFCNFLFYLKFNFQITFTLAMIFTTYEQVSSMHAHYLSGFQST